MDVGLVSFVMAAVVAEGFATKDEASWIASIGFVGMAIGASFGGLLADRFGRRQVFALSLVVYGIATGASALASSAALLMALRFFVGLGLGAELPVASTLVSEFAPRRIRGRVVVWLEAFWAVGWVLAALIGRFVVPTGDDGWRWALAIGMVPTAYAVVVRLGLPESVRYLERRGRGEEAESIVRDFERSARVSAPSHAVDGRGRPLASAAASSTALAARTEARAQAPQPASAASIWSTELRGRTIGIWTIWFCINLAYYGAFIWIPTVLVEAGFPLVKSFEFTLIMTAAQLPGYAAAAWAIEALGRRTTLAVFLAGSAVSAIAFGLASSEGMILAAGCLLSFFNLGAWGALYAIGPELYPTTIRGAGTGAAAGFGRVASIVAPLVVPAILASGGRIAAFAVFGLAFALATGAAFLLPEQRGKRLDP